MVGTPAKPVKRRCGRTTERARGTRHKARGTRHKARGTRHKAPGIRRSGDAVGSLAWPPVQSQLPPISMPACLQHAACCPANRPAPSRQG
ncbi:MAG: hypothetical protein B1H04_03030 [Planctomycetales bacterium 4484_123]|nr:MAG: hypothetical protein B1H04_03030 [Planctomycetales bacterium 4484_123]